jgi:hypothetical protein
MIQNGDEQIGEPELARLSFFQPCFLRLQFLARQHQLRWSANPVTLSVRRMVVPKSQSFSRKPNKRPIYGTFESVAWTCWRDSSFNLVVAW